jgi:hypothetical protein
VALNPPVASPSGYQVHGFIVRVEGSRLTLRRRDGRLITVDISQALAAQHAGMLPLGQAIVVHGYIDARGILRVTNIGHTEQSPEDWPGDSF